jgi:hypothetical protein
MDIFKGLNLLVRFLLELCMLAAVGYWGFKTHSTWWFKIFFGIGLPLLIVILWGLYIAPKATHPLGGASRLVLELILLGSGAVSLFASGKPGLGWVYLITLTLNEILLFAYKQWNAPIQ